jgi:hypothetical protein
MFWVRTLQIHLRLGQNGTGPAMYISYSSPAPKNDTHLGGRIEQLQGQAPESKCTVNAPRGLMPASENPGGVAMLHRWTDSVCGLAR